MKCHASRDGSKLPTTHTRHVSHVRFEPATARIPKTEVGMDRSLPFASGVAGSSAQKRRQNAASAQQQQQTATQQQQAGQSGFQKARSACLEGRGYSVK